jgi:hypothetical protein
MRWRRTRRRRREDEEHEETSDWGENRLSRVSRRKLRRPSLPPPTHPRTYLVVQGQREALEGGADEGQDARDEGEVVHAHHAINAVPDFADGTVPTTTTTTIHAKDVTQCMARY